MATPSAQLATVLSLAAVLSQVACSRAIHDGSDDGAGGGVSSGGTTATGGSGDTGMGGVGATGATPPCPEFPDASECGEDGCQLGESFPAGGEGDDCLYVLQSGGSGACGPGEEMGPCQEIFCDGGEWLSWYLDCP